MIFEKNLWLAVIAGVFVTTSCRADDPAPAPVPAGYAWKTAFVKRGVSGNYKTEWAGGLNATTRLRIPMQFEGTQAKVYFKPARTVDVDLAKLSLAPGADDKGTTTGKLYPINTTGAPTLHLAANGKDVITDAAEVPITKGTWYLQQAYSTPEYTYAFDRDNFFFGAPDQEATASLGKQGRGAWLGNAYRIDVLTKDTRPSIICIGDSITQGYNSTPNTYTRYPDVLGKILDRPTLNYGQNGDLVVYAKNGAASLTRDIKGADTVILLMGINDIIGGSVKTADAYADVVMTASKGVKAQGLKFYIGTIIPSGGYKKFDEKPENEILRLSINDWIRTKAPVDGVIDFDKALADPENAGKMRAEYQSDWLHPSDAGYQKMGEAAAAVLKK